MEMLPGKLICLEREEILGSHKDENVEFLVNELLQRYEMEGYRMSLENIGNIFRGMMNNEQRKYFHQILTLPRKM